MSYRRGWIALLLFSLAMINYIDRITLSFAIGPIAKEFALNDVAKGYLFSSFLWTYTLFLIPMGMLVDRYGSKKVAGWGIGIWSIATVLTGTAAGIGTLLASRLAMGTGEASSNPCGAKIIREWIPSGERGVINAAFNSGSYAGPAICALIAGTIIETFGWRALFIGAGAVGLLWLLAWILVFDKPETTRWLGEDERQKILSERNAQSKATASDSEPVGLLRLMRTKTLWGLALTQGCNVYCQYLFLTWLPSYLQSTKHLTLLKTGLYTAVPYAVAVVLCIAMGRLSDRLLARSGAASGRRRNMIASAMVIAAVILLAPFLENVWVLLALITISLTGIATTTSLNFALLNDLLPNPKDVGKAMGFLVVGGNVFGLMAPIVTGYVISISGSYDWAFGIAGLLLVCGATATLTLTRKPMIAAANKAVIALIPSEAL
jgi:MFS family permease